MARKKNYLNNKDFYDEICISLEAGELTKTAEKMIILLADRIANRMYYHNPDDRADCVQTAYLNVFKYWKKFNPKFTNAFSYFTSIVKNGLAEGWGKLHPLKTKGTISMNRINNEGYGDDGMFNI
jgi:hypothetical protein